MTAPFKPITSAEGEEDFGEESDDYDEEFEVQPDVCVLVACRVNRL